MKLRTASKQASNDGNMALKITGTVASPYTKRMGTPRQRMGTPRQGSLVSSFRSAQHSDGNSGCTSNSTVMRGSYLNSMLCMTDPAERKKTKIRPPRGGIKSANFPRACHIVQTPSACHLSRSSNLIFQITVSVCQSLTWRMVLLFMT